MTNDVREPDLSDEHAGRIARHLFSAFGDASWGREPLYYIDRMSQWHALARAAIQIGAVIPEADR